MKVSKILLAAVALTGSLSITSCTDAKTAAKCATLSTSEQQFSNQLSSSNQTIFCSQFTSDQRGSAMRMMGQKDAQGNTMSADQAVQQVYQKASAGKAGGGCSVN